MMRTTLMAVFMAASIMVSFSWAQGPEVEVNGDKLSVRAEAVSLGQLLGVLDQNTGMLSKVPPELANRNISVQFSDLSLSAGVRKIFEGQKLDYIYIGGKGIFVTAVSQSTVAQDQQALPSPQVISSDPFNQNQVPGQFPPQFQPQNDIFAPPPVQSGQPVTQPGQQPAMIQTPFGPIPNPRANQNGANPFQGQGQGAAPAQQNPLGNPGVFGAPSAMTPTPLGGNTLGNTPGPGGSGTIPGLSPTQP